MRSTSAAVRKDSSHEVLGFPIGETLSRELRGLALRSIPRRCEVLLAQADSHAEPWIRALEAAESPYAEDREPGPRPWTRQSAGADAALVPKERFDRFCDWLRTGTAQSAARRSPVP